MTEDAILLQRFAANRSEEAFSELVRRKLNLVYSTALRATGGDRHLAEDVCQQVFALLARRAGTLVRHPALTGWLHTTAHFTAAKLMRTARRRQAREREAQAMQQILSFPPADVDWDRLRPVLDEAMFQLNERDREAVLLRYFENRPFAEVGARQGLSENAARMRVDRALDKLQVVLARRGITSTATALTGLFAEHAVVAAPAGLAATVSGAALAGAGGSAAWWTLMTAPKLLAAVTGAAAIAIGVGVVRQQQSIARLRAEAADLRQQNRTIAALRTDNRRLQRLQLPPDELKALQHDHVELAQVRANIASLGSRLASFRRPAAAWPAPKIWDGRPVYDLRDLDAAPSIRRQVRPLYPLAMRFDGAAGEAVVGFIVDTHGDVVAASVIDATAPVFGETSVDAVRQWKFSPGMKDGRPVETRMSVPIVYMISGKPAGNRP